MLIAIFYLLKNIALPQLGVYANALIASIMPIVVMLVGFVMLFGALGMKISNNLGSTVISGIFRAIGYLCRTLFQGLGWIIRNTFRLIPLVFYGSRRYFNQLGFRASHSNILAFVILVLFVAIVI